MTTGLEAMGMNLDSRRPCQSTTTPPERRPTDPQKCGIHHTKGQTTKATNGPIVDRSITHQFAPSARIPTAYSPPTATMIQQPLSHSHPPTAPNIHNAPPHYPATPPPHSLRSAYGTPHTLSLPRSPPVDSYPLARLESHRLGTATTGLRITPSPAVLPVHVSR